MMLYMEGRTELRASMAQFIRRATGPIDLKVKPCGSGSEAIKQCADDVNALLLIDSEGAATAQFIQGIESQIGAANRAFFMVQLMEAWFLADRATLANYFGAGFRDRALPRNLNVEDIPKPDVENGLRSATRNCRKGPYRKGADDTRLLALLNPTAVYHACPNFARLIDFLRNNGGS